MPKIAWTKSFNILTFFWPAKTVITIMVITFFWTFTISLVLLWTFYWSAKKVFSATTCSKKSVPCFSDHFLKTVAVVISNHFQEKDLLFILALKRRWKAVRLLSWLPVSSWNFQQIRPNQEAIARNHVVSDFTQEMLSLPDRIYTWV